MTVFEALASRFSCRAFRPDPVSRTEIEEILGAALRAPSWANTQPWEIYVAAGVPLERIRSGYLDLLERGVEGAPELARPASWPPALRARSAELMTERRRFFGGAGDEDASRREHLRNNHRLFGAPCVLWLCMDRALTHWSAHDLGAIGMAIMLAARERGIDSVPAVMLAIHPEVVRAELGVPPELAIVVGIALGHADTDSPQSRFRSTRRPLAQVARFSGF